MEKNVSSPIYDLYKDLSETFGAANSFVKNKLRLETLNESRIPEARKKNESVRVQKYTQEVERLNAITNTESENDIKSKIENLNKKINTIDALREEENIGRSFKPLKYMYDALHSTFYDKTIEKFPLIKQTLHLIVNKTGFDLNREIWTFGTAGRQQCSILSISLGKNFPGYSNCYQGTSLYLAKILIEAGANINKKDSDEETPLQYFNTLVEAKKEKNKHRFDYKKCLENENIINEIDELIKFPQELRGLSTELIDTIDSIKQTTLVKLNNKVDLSDEERNQVNSLTDKLVLLNKGKEKIIQYIVNLEEENGKSKEEIQKYLDDYIEQNESKLVVKLLKNTEICIDKIEYTLGIKHNREFTDEDFIEEISEPVNSENNTPVILDQIQIHTSLHKNENNLNYDTINPETTETKDNNAIQNTNPKSKITLIQNCIQSKGNLNDQIINPETTETKDNNAIQNSDPKSKITLIQKIANFLERKNINQF
jgi:hypothetical protein